MGAGEDVAVIGRIISHYHEIREGIGVHKSPELYARSPLILIPTRPDLREYSSLA